MKPPTLKMYEMRIVHYIDGNLAFRYAAVSSDHLFSLPVTWSMVPAFCQFGRELEFTLKLGK